MKRLLTVSALFALLAFAIAYRSSGSSSVTATQNSQQSAVFVTGEGAPLPSVLAFNVTLNSITLHNSSTRVSVLSTAQTVFARLLGLRTLIGFNSVPPATYTGATIQLSSPSFPISI
jgi:hypothetical protein